MNIYSWCAGVLDADGCFVAWWEPARTQGSLPSLKTQCAIVIREEIVADIFIELFGGSKRFSVPKNPNHSATWHWKCSGVVLDKLLRVLLPHLVLKMPQALVLMKIRAVRERTSKKLTKEEHSMYDALHREIVSLNQTGVGKPDWLVPVSYYTKQVQ